MKKLSAVARERLFVGQKLRRGGRRAVSARAQRRGGRERAKGTGVVAGARWERWGAPLELRSASTTTTTTTAHHHFPPLPSPPPLSLLLNPAPPYPSCCVCASIRTRRWCRILARLAPIGHRPIRPTTRRPTRPSRPDDVPALYTASSLPFAPIASISRHARCDPRGLPSLLDTPQARVVESHLCCCCSTPRRLMHHTHRIVTLARSPAGPRPGPTS